GRIRYRGDDGAGDQRADTGDLGQALADRVGAVPSHNLRLDLCDAPVELLQLPDENAENRPSGLRDRALVLDAGAQTTHVPDALRLDDPELGQVTPQRVHDLGPLPDEELAGPVHDE